MSSDSARVGARGIIQSVVFVKPLFLFEYIYIYAASYTLIQNRRQRHGLPGSTPRGWMDGWRIKGMYDIWSQNLVTKPGHIVWSAQNLGTESGHRIWAQNLGTESGRKIWAQNLGTESGRKIWVQNMLTHSR